MRPPPPFLQLRFAGDRSVHVRRKARNAKADRERQIVSLLNRGISVAEIASRSRISIKHMRNLVRNPGGADAPAAG
jgi:hypothetical protein